MTAIMTGLSAWSQAFSLRFKIMGLSVGMVLLMGLSATVLAQVGFSRSSITELELRGISIAQDVAVRGADMILTHDALGLHELVQSTLKNNPDVRYVMMVNSQGRLIAHTFGDRFPVDLLGLPTPPGGGPAARTLLSTDEGTIHDLAVPILEGLAGTVRVGMSPERLQFESLRLTEWLTATVLLMATLALIWAYVLTTFLTRPVLSLVEATQAAGRGDLSRRAPPGPPDEIGQLIDSFNDMLGRLEEARQIRRELLNRILSAQEEERRRIARELHDETSQAITSMIVGLRTLEVAHPEIGVRTADLQTLAARILGEIHHLILELRPRVLDELGLVPALRLQVQECARKYGLSVELQTYGEEMRLPVQVENCLYRVAQEALTNVVRHSGATNASVIIGVQAGHVTMVVEDDGHGFDLSTDVGVQSLGIIGMRERVFLVDGTLEIESSGLGTTLFARIPLKEEHAHASTDRAGG